jgi:tetratricopeptide (TPR) repeat protein
MLLTAGIAMADGGGGGGGGSETFLKPMHPDLERATQRIAQEDFAAALPLLEKVVREDDTNADAFNLLGYSLRKLERYDEALRNYERALKINPKHRGAHEYIGETYLALNLPEKAKVHLAALDDQCWFGCEEYDDLKEAIAEYEAAHGS